MDTIHSNDFDAAGRAVLLFLHQRLGFDLWMITRTQGDDWIVLQSEDHGYGVAAGKVFPWRDSFCSEMVKGNGPHIAPQSDVIPAYALAPIGRQVQIKAYAGVPIVLKDGSLFGTLCAIDPVPQSPQIVEQEELLLLLGSLLSTILQLELRSAEEVRRSERIQAEALTDSVTRLYNRRGWDLLLAAEEARCSRYGHPGVIFYVDLDGLKQINDFHGHAAGDELIIRASQALRQAARSIDIIARLGGDEFGIVGVECDVVGAQALLKRVQSELEMANVKASIGFAMRDPSIGLAGAWVEADKNMYSEKRSQARAS